MKESIGYTLTINIVIIFITVIFAFLFAILVYFRSNKLTNAITSAIEKYEGYNVLAIAEIEEKIKSLSYNTSPIKCDEEVSDRGAVGEKCALVNSEYGNGSRGYCVYYCAGIGYYDGEYYHYKVRTNMMINIPIISDVLNIPIYSNTNWLYDFEG